MTLRLLILACLTNAVMGLLYVWSLFLLPLEAALGAPRSALSLIPALALVTFTLGMMVHDRLLAALRFRAFSLLAFGFAGGGHLLFAFDGGYAALLTGYGMLFGLGAGLGYGLALALVTRLPTRVRSLGLGLAMAAFAISGVVLSGLFAQPIRETDPTAGFLIIGLAILAAGSGVTAFLPTQPARPMAVQECARPAAKPRRGARGPTAAPGQPASPDDRNRWTGRSAARCRSARPGVFPEAYQ
ncbi:hypothetical protein [Paracoccus versutus]|uniref:hypothetical protein n=1 Tax=Paracoccus versutus TaxID=34007 RepID=UPI003C7DFA34